MYVDSTHNSNGETTAQGTENSRAQRDFTLLRCGYDGESLSQWTEKWWTWAYQAPYATNPLSDTTGADAGVDNNGPVFFIAGTFSTSGGASSANRSFDVPAGKPLLIPMLNHSDTLDPKSTETEIMENFRHSVTSLFGTIDGVSITDPKSDLVNTGFFSMGKTQSGSLIAELGAPVGAELYPTRSSGYWLMVSGLGPGEHTLSFGGSLIPEATLDSGSDLWSAANDNRGEAISGIAFLRSLPSVMAGPLRRSAHWASDGRRAAATQAFLSAARGSVGGPR